MSIRRVGKPRERLRGQSASSALTALFSFAAAVTGVDRVHAQTLQVVPDESEVFLFSGPEGGPFLPQSGTVWTVSDADSAGFDFNLSSNQPWLAAQPAGGDFGILGNQTREVTASLVNAHANALAPGVYTAEVSFTNLANGAGDTLRLVQLTVAPANFTVEPPFVTAQTTVNGAAPAPVLVTVAGTGQADLNYNLVSVPQSWYSLSKTSGTVPAGGTDTFTVFFNPAGLQAGTQTALVLVRNATNGAGTTQLSISLTVVSVGTGSVTLSPDADIAVGGAAAFLSPPSPQVNDLINNSDRSVLWQATPSEDWISVLPSGGELSPAGAAGGRDRQRVEIRLNQGINALDAGAHVATVQFRNLTTGVAIATRVARVTADPVLSLPGGLTGGSITPSPAGATLSSTQQVYRLGQVVTITAAAADGFEFDGWASDAALEDPLANPLVVTMDTSRSFGATFTPLLRTLSLSFTGSGTGTVRATPTGAFTENELISKYGNGAVVTLSADADAGATFLGWAGNVPVGKETDNPLMLTLDRDRTITARFEGEVTLDVEVNGDGTVTVEPEQDRYTAGAIVTLTPVADEGFEFDGWGGDAGGADAPLVVRLDENTVIEASFVEKSDGPVDPDQFRLTITIEGDGSVEPGSGEFDAGKEVLLIATPDVGFIFVGWEDDADGTELTTTVVMDQDRTVRAIFEAEDGGAPQPNPGGGGGGSTCGAIGMLGLPMMAFGALMLDRVRGRSARRGGR